METNKILSALSYFSVLFAGILFPLVVMLVSSDSRVKGHAKKALLSHLIPIIPIPIILISAFSQINNANPDFPVLFFIAVGASIILSFVVLIWNIIKGVKILTKNEI